MHSLNLSFLARQWHNKGMKRNYRIGEGADGRPARAVFPADRGAFHLLPGGLLTLDGDWRGVALHLRRGRVWITQEGDAADHLPVEGDPFIVGRRGRVVVQALTEACVQIVDGSRGAPRFPLPRRPFWLPRNKILS